jgi:hypothetical protein
MSVPLSPHNQCHTTITSTGSAPQTQAHHRVPHGADRAIKQSKTRVGKIGSRQRTRCSQRSRTCFRHRCTDQQWPSYAGSVAARFDEFQ